MALARRAASRPPALAGSLAQPGPDQRHQLVRLDRLGDVVRGAGAQALLPIALHRLGRHGDYRELAKSGLSPIAALGRSPSLPRHIDVLTNGSTICWPLRPPRR